ncbi:MAG: hypothetical protein IPI34_12795 [bacterium]|nr:hypothetical protein [bacterium]
MFAATSVLRRAPLLLAAMVLIAILAGLTGCSKEKVVDPYLSASLSAVMAGADSVRSPDFLFEVDGPPLYFARGDVAIVKQGNQMHFLVGPALQTEYAGKYQGQRLGVQKRFTDRATGTTTTHLFLMGTRQGGAIARVDSVANYALPSMLKLTKQQIETPGTNLNEMNARLYSTFQPLLPANAGDRAPEVQSMVEHFVYVPRHDLSEAQRANPKPGDYSWYIVLDNATLRVVDLDPGASYMLELLKEKNLPLVGSFSLISVSDSILERTKSYGTLRNVCGTIRINWFKVANTAIRGS